MTVIQTPRLRLRPARHDDLDALHAVLPHATRGQVAWAYQFALGALLHHLSDNRVERLSRGENTVGDAAGDALLVDFIVGGIRAALAPPAAPARQPTHTPKTNRRRLA